MDIHQTKLWMLTDCNCCGELMKVSIADGLELLSAIHKQHVEANPTCKAYFDSLPSLSDICKSLGEIRAERPQLTVADMEPVLPLRRKLSRLVEDADGRLVMSCDCCGKLYTDRIDEDPWFCCPCGRLTQRMDEATAEQCGIVDPAWHDKVTQPGRWVLVGRFPDGTEPTLWMDVTQEQLDRGSPYYVLRAFGPIPEDS